MKISGQSEEEVEAVMSFFTEKVSPLTIVAGGFGFRAVCFAILMGMFAILSYSGLRLGAGRTGWILVITQLGLLIFLVIVPWSSLLPGFAVYRGDPSFEVRYGAQIGFWGFVVGAIPVILELAKAVRGKK